jgi:hypothetical protein
MQGANRGGPGRGQGRKPVKAGKETVTVSLRVTVAQREKLARLGGAEWVRGKIDRAKEPNVELSGPQADLSPEGPARTQG